MDFVEALAKISNLTLRLESASHPITYITLQADSYLSDTRVHIVALQNRKERLRKNQLQSKSIVLRGTLHTCMSGEYLCSIFIVYVGSLYTWD